MDWNDLHLFVSVARAGTVRAAAKELHIDASTVSRRLAALEIAIGAHLFERTRHGLAMTSVGKLVLESGQRVDGELEELGRRVVGHDNRLRGVVRVTFPGSFMELVHEAAAAFAACYPAIELELLGADTMVDVDGRQADVAVRVADAPPPHLMGRRLARLAGALYASRRYVELHPQPLQDSRHAWVEWDRRLASKPAFAWIERSFPGRRIALRGLSTSDVLCSVRQGVGIGALPCLVADADAALVRLRDAPGEVGFERLGVDPRRRASRRPGTRRRFPPRPGHPGGATEHRRQTRPRSAKLAREARSGATGRCQPGEGEELGMRRRAVPRCESLRFRVF